MIDPNPENTFHSRPPLADSYDVIVIGGTGEFTYGLSFADQSDRHYEGEDFPRALRDALAGKHVVVIARPRHLDLWYESFPTPSREEREGRYAWVEYSASR